MPFKECEETGPVRRRRTGPFFPKTSAKLLFQKSILLFLPLASISLFLVPSIYSAKKSPYTQLERPSDDGIGKVYMNREISNVLGATGVLWLERKSRLVTERPDLIVPALALEPTAHVADIGAGSGYLTFQIAPKVPKGKVYAVDISPPMIRRLMNRRLILKEDNVQPILGTVTNPKLPEGKIDVVLMVDAYHEFSHPREMMTEIVKALKPTGRVVLVEYRGEDPSVPIKPLHKMTEKQAILEMKAVGLTHVETKNFLPQQHFMVFQKLTAK